VAVIRVEDYSFYCAMSDRQDTGLQKIHCCFTRLWIRKGCKPLIKVTFHVHYILLGVETFPTFR